MEPKLHFGTSDDYEFDRRWNPLPFAIVLCTFAVGSEGLLVENT